MTERFQQIRLKSSEYGRVAQLVEHIVHIDGVTGTSPVATTKNLNNNDTLLFASKPPYNGGFDVFMGLFRIILPERIFKMKLQATIEMTHYLQKSIYVSKYGLFRAKSKWALILSFFPSSPVLEQRSQIRPDSENIWKWQISFID